MRFLKLPTPLFTRAELWFHLLLAPVLYPATNGLLVGERYFKDLQVFVSGTLTLLALQTVAVLILTVLIKSIIARYPDPRQAQRRNITALVAGALVTAGLAVWVVWVYSQIPLLQTTFTLNVVLYTIGLGIIVSFFLGYVLIVTDTYIRWQQNQTEKEQLRQLTMQQQVDALKGQINPHFLFNSLNSISALIADEPQQAETFVDEMAKVYRYLLQAHTRTLVPLAQEVQFVRSYAHLLEVRYRQALSIMIHVPAGQTAEKLGEYGVPPLTLRNLIDDILYHQVLTVGQPLRITIQIGAEQPLLITYNRQPRALRVESQLPGFADVVRQYKALSEAAPHRLTVGSDEQIWLPTIFIPAPISANTNPEIST